MPTSPAKDNIHSTAALTHRMTARLSLSPTYVTTYMSGAQNSNSRSQLMMVDSGALMRNGPRLWP